MKYTVVFFFFFFFIFFFTQIIYYQCSICGKLKDFVGQKL